MRCVIPGCEKEVNGTYWLCRDCAFVYGPPRTWDEWLKELRRIEDRRRLVEANRVDSGIDIVEYVDKNPRAKLGKTGRSLRSRSNCDPESGLPLAPYGDERLDREYRRANGLKINL